MVWYFIGVYIINRTLHGRLEIRNFSSCVENNFTSERFNTRREISYLCATMEYPLFLIKGSVNINCAATLVLWGSVINCWLRSVWARSPFCGKWREPHKNILTRDKAIRGRDKDSGLKCSPFPFPSLPFPCSCLSSPLPCHSLMASPKWKVYLQAIDYYVNFPL